MNPRIPQNYWTMQPSCYSPSGTLMQIRNTKQASSSTVPLYFVSLNGLLRGAALKLLIAEDERQRRTVVPDAEPDSADVKEKPVNLGSTSMSSSPSASAAISLSSQPASSTTTWSPSEDITPTPLRLVESQAASTLLTKTSRTATPPRSPQRRSSDPLGHAPYFDDHVHRVFSGDDVKPAEQEDGLFRFRDDESITQFAKTVLSHSPAAKAGSHSANPSLANHVMLASSAEALIHGPPSAASDRPSATAQLVFGLLAQPAIVTPQPVRTPGSADATPGTNDWTTRRGADTQEALSNERHLHIPANSSSFGTEILSEEGQEENSAPVEPSTSPLSYTMHRTPDKAFGSDGQNRCVFRQLSSVTYTQVSHRQAAIPSVSRQPRSFSAPSRPSPLKQSNIPPTHLEPTERRYSSPSSPSPPTRSSPRKRVSLPANPVSESRATKRTKLGPGTEHAPGAGANGDELHSEPVRRSRTKSTKLQQMEAIANAKQLAKDENAKKLAKTAETKLAKSMAVAAAAAAKTPARRRARRG